MRKDRRLFPLLLSGVFGAQLALACGSDSSHTQALPEPCAWEDCVAGGGAGGSMAVAGDAGRANGNAGEGGAVGDAGAAGESSAEGGSAGTASARDLEARVEEAVESIQSDRCFAENDSALCDWADYEVGPAHFDMEKSTGEALLLIDDFGAGFYPELVRYRNRIRGFYRITGDEAVSQVLSVHLPRRLGDVLVSFAGPEFIPARELARVGSAANARYGQLNLLYYGHGGVVFGHAVELVPEQPLVLLDLTNLFGIPPAVCAGIDGQTLAAATAHFSAIAASLKQLMSEQQVHFINASFGSTVPDLATDWARSCGDEVPSSSQLRELLHAYDPIYEVLFNTEAVLTAHAAAALGDPEDYPFDQLSPKYPNRVRVGFISSQNSGLDEAGRGVVQKADQFPNLGDADVFFNWGCEMTASSPTCAEPHYEFAGPFGLGAATVALMSTSYVNPLGIARLVNLRYARHADEPMSDALIQTLRQELTPTLCGDGGTDPCLYQDPLAHRQLEPYRLGYR